MSSHETPPVVSKGVLDLSKSPSSLYSLEGMRWLRTALIGLEGSDYIVIHVPSVCKDSSQEWISWLENHADRHLMQRDLGEIRSFLRDFFRKHDAIGLIEGSVTGSYFDLMLFARVIVVKSRGIQLGFPAARVGVFPALGGLELSQVKGMRGVEWGASPDTKKLLKAGVVIYNPFAHVGWDFSSFIPDAKVRDKRKWFSYLRQSPSDKLPDELGSDSLWSHKGSIFQKKLDISSDAGEEIYHRLLASQFFQSKYQSYLSRSITGEGDVEKIAPTSVQLAVDSAAVPNRFLKLFFVSPMCKQIYFHADDMMTLTDSIYFLKKKFDGKKSRDGSLWEEKASFFTGSKVNDNIPNFIWNSSGQFAVHHKNEFIQFYHLDPAGSLVEIIEESSNTKELALTLQSIGIQSVKVPKLIEGLPLTVLAQSAVFQSLSELSEETDLPFSFFTGQLKSRGWNLAGSLKQWSTFLNRRFLYFSHFRDHPKLTEFGLSPDLFEKDYVDNLRLKTIGDEEAMRWNPYRVETRVIKDLAKKIGSRMEHGYKEVGILSIAAGIPLDSGRLLHESW